MVGGSQVELVLLLVVVLVVVDGELFVVVSVVVEGVVFIVVVVVDGFVDVGVVLAGSRSGGFLIDRTIHIVVKRIRYFIFYNSLC